MDSHVNIGVSSEPPSTSVPPLSPSLDVDFILGDEPQSLENFSIPNFTFQD